MSIDKYNRKRNFAKTEEPIGKKTTNNRKELIFVVQHHVASRDHYDFRLEHNGALKSWAVPKGPSYNPMDKRLAVMVEDHPYDYRDFEGNIPKNQYGGGTVMIWDEGIWVPTTDYKEGFKDGNIKFELKGKKLKGKWALVRMKDNNWLLIKEEDKFANDIIDLKKYDFSVRSGRTMNEIAKN